MDRDQALDILPMYNEYCARLAQLSAESAATLAAMQATMLGQPLASLGGSMQRYVDLMEATGRLSRQPDEALFALLEFMYFLGEVMHCYYWL